MRLCALCPPKTPDFNKQHLDKFCPNVSDATKKAHFKKLKEERVKRRQERENSANKESSPPAGGAKLSRSEESIKTDDIFAREPG